MTEAASIHAPLCGLCSIDLALANPDCPGPHESEEQWEDKQQAALARPQLHSVAPPPQAVVKPSHSCQRCVQVPDCGVTKQFEGSDIVHVCSRISSHYSIESVHHDNKTGVSWVELGSR